MTYICHIHCSIIYLYKNYIFIKLKGDVLLMSETKYCQSCGMPMDESYYGSNKDGSKNQEYCSYCYKDGAFSADITMEEMIEGCIAPMVEHNKDMTEEQAKKMMQEFFPTLKRWKKS